MAKKEKMYAIVCGAASDAIDLMQEDRVQDAINLLGEMLRRAEDLYLED